MRARIAIPVAAVAVTGLLATAGAASAAPHQVTVRALTFIKDRPDSGNAGDWADDTMTRAITITQTGGSPGAYTFTAKLADDGTFKAIKGAQVPNQAAPYAGDVIKSAVTGSMNGYADFSFTASRLPRTTFNAGVPVTENDHGLDPADSTSTWYELAFPAGTVFGGAGIGNWGWTYDAIVVTRAFPFLSLEQWIDAWDNNYGDSAGDGQITG